MNDKSIFLAANFLTQINRSKMTTDEVATTFAVAILTYCAGQTFDKDELDDFLDTLFAKTKVYEEKLLKGVFD